MRRLAQSLAMLDAIISPEWQDRYYSFNSQWSADKRWPQCREGCGSGDDWFLLFSQTGAALKGFAHELASDSQFAKSIQEVVPKSFSSFLQEPASRMQYATFCYWCLADENIWKSVAHHWTESINNFGFEIERKYAPLNPLPGGEEKGWVIVGFVENQGDPNSLTEYSFIDVTPHDFAVKI